MLGNRYKATALGIALVIGATIAPVSSVHARSEVCVPSAPAAVVDAIDKYLHAFVTNDLDDAMAVPLAPDVRRSNLPPILPQRLGGPITVRNAEQLRAEYLVFPTFYFVNKYGGLRVYVDGCAAVAFLWLNFETSEAEPPDAIPPQLSKYFRVTAHIGLRAWVSGGVIEELELMQARSEGHAYGTCWPANGDPNQGRTDGCEREPTTDPLAPVPGCVPGSRSQMQAAARSYIDALDSHDASNVLLAQTARRTEMPPAPGRGPVTGTTGAEIRDSIENGARQPIAATRNVRWTVEEGRCHVNAHWLADTDPTGTVHHVTRFMVSGGVIYEIEDIWVLPITPGAIEGSCWPKVWPDVEDETYRLVACPPVE